MEELIVALQDRTEMTVVPDKYLEEIRGQLPQNEKECRIYAMLTAATLMNELSNSELDVVLVYNYLELRYEAKQYHDMHMFLSLCYLAMGLEIPPYFTEFIQFEDLLKILMREMLQSIGKYLIDVCEIDLEAFNAD